MSTNCCGSLLLRRQSLLRLLDYQSSFTVLVCFLLSYRDCLYLGSPWLFSFQFLFLILLSGIVLGSFSGGSSHWILLYVKNPTLLTPVVTTVGFGSVCFVYVLSGGILQTHKRIMNHLHLALHFRFTISHSTEEEFITVSQFIGLQHLSIVNFNVSSNNKT